MDMDVRNPERSRLGLRRQFAENWPMFPEKPGAAVVRRRVSLENRRL